MPNYCENELHIRGSHDEVERLLTFVGLRDPEPCFDFNRIIPYPEPFKAMDDDMHAIGRDRWNRESPAFKAYEAKWGTGKDGFNSGGYEWRVANHGTKWGAIDVRLEGGVVRFQTAWSAPEPVIVALAKMFPDVTLSLEWFECGIAKCGGFTCYSREDAGEGRPAGVACDRWGGEYLGTKGG